MKNMSVLEKVNKDLLLSREEVMQLLNYDPITRKLTWSENCPKEVIGKEVPHVLEWMVIHLKIGIHKYTIRVKRLSSSKNIQKKQNVFEKMKNGIVLSYDDLKQLIDYDPQTGKFTWSKLCPKQMHGHEAGYVNEDGYTQFKLGRFHYSAHRLAWWITHGYFPENEIDHEDQDKTNNKIDNLREISHQCNVRNTGNPKDNKSGVKGVSWDKKANKWTAQITVNHKLIYLGNYIDFDDAVCARLAAEQSLNWAGCDSSSPAYLHVKQHIQPNLK